jgi:hypothetical protein
MCRGGSHHKEGPCSLVRAPLVVEASELMVSGLVALVLLERLPLIEATCDGTKR